MFCMTTFEGNQGNGKEGDGREGEGEGAWLYSF